tara:strand:+ start:100 stop:288 length:189 start_codon:yes stop_codon:yes gene_type:complete
MKRVISKKTIKEGKKTYTLEQYWSMFPSDRIITTKTRKLTIGEWLLVVICSLTSALIIGGLL